LAIDSESLRPSSSKNARRADYKPTLVGCKRAFDIDARQGGEVLMSEARQGREGRIVQITTNQLSMSACFAQNGKPYANLSQVAKAMAGSGGNGRWFFRLQLAKFDRVAPAGRRSHIAISGTPASVRS
jgi:hypothetical protein